MDKIDNGQETRYNIVIPVVFKDFSFLKRTLKYIYTNLNPQKVYLIVDKRYLSYIPKSIFDNRKCILIDENKLIPGLSYNRIDSLLKIQNRNHTKTGWYFQQFLKMGFSLSIYCDTDYYLVWDSDTIPLRKIDFFDKNGHPFFSMKSEYHKPYFDTIFRLLALEKNIPNSYIAEHMMIESDVMRELINKINMADVIGEMWYEKILNALVDEIISPFSFSEFETYGTFCSHYYPDLYKERQLPGMRRGGLIQGRFVSERILSALAADMYVASFEIYDRPPQPWKFVCDMYEKYLKYKELWIKKRI